MTSPAPRSLTVLPGTFRHAPATDQVALRDGDTLHLICREGLTPVALLRGLDQARHAHGGSGRLGAGFVELSGMLLTSLVFLLTLGILDIFGNSLHHVIGEWVYEEGASHDDAIREGRLLLLSTLLFFAGMVAVRLFRRLPLFEENLESVGHTVRLVVEDFLNSKRRQRRRLRQRLKRLGADQVARIEVWNPQSTPGAAASASHGAAPADPLAWSILLPALGDVSRPDCALVLHIRQDEVTEVRAAAQALPGLAVDVAADPRPAPSGNAPSTLIDLIPATEQAWLPLLALAAFDPEALTPLAPASGARIFSENAFHRLLPLAGNGITRAQASRFLNRCLNDYGLLRDDPDSGLWFLAEGSNTADQPAARDGALWAALFHGLSANAQTFVEADDPLTHLVVSAALCAMLHDLPASAAGTRRRLAQQLLEVVGGFIAAVEKSERYDLMKRVMAGSGRRNLQDLGRYLPRVVDAGASVGAAAFTQELAETARFNAFGYDTLARLGRLFEVVGAYPEAIAIWTKLAPLDPTRARIRLARLEERSGDPHAAAQAIDPLLAELDAASDSGSGAALAVPPLLRAEAYLEGAWIIYSVLDEARRDEGRQRLDAARRWLLASPPEAGSQGGGAATAIAYWRYHNYLALYLDWAGDYPAALDEHRRALAIPGVSGKWYSGTLSNIAYVARKAALSSAGDPAVCRARLDDAVTAATLAADLKERLGDEDELPVALHNLAVSHYCRAVLDDAAAPSRAAALTAAASAAREGLAWLDKIDSDKKRGALLLETLLADHAAGAATDASVLAALAELPANALAPAERRARELLAAAGDEAARRQALDELGRRVLQLELLT